MAVFYYTELSIRVLFPVYKSSIVRKETKQHHEKIYNC